MGKYLDLHIIPQLEDKLSCERMAELLRVSHFSTIGLTVPTGLLQDRVKPLRSTFEQKGISTVVRADFSPSSRTELLRILRRFRNQYDIIAVKCVNQRVTTVACRDRRVDVIFFGGQNDKLRFTHTFARLLRGAIEFNLVSDMERKDSITFSRMRKAMGVAEEHRLKVILSSGARNNWMIRSPIELSALAASLGLSQQTSMTGVSSTPLSIVAENRKKREAEYVEEGVRIIVPSGGRKA